MADKDSNPVYGRRLGYEDDIFDGRVDYVFAEPLFLLGSWVLGCYEIYPDVTNRDNNFNILDTAKGLTGMVIKSVVALNLFPLVAAARAVESRKLKRFPEGYRLKSKLEERI